VCSSDLLLADAVAGGATLDGMAAAARSRGEPVHAPVHALAVRPSQDLGALAGEHLRRLSWVGGSPVVHGLLKLVDTGEGTGSDLASYVLFDHGYTRELLALGRADAERQADALLSFLEGRSAPAPSAAR
jgi:NTE family protein